MRFFSLHDSAAGAFMRPFLSQSQGAAIRSFTDLVNDPEHPVGQHPEDYTLFEIGAFDEASGNVLGCEPHSLGNGVSYVTPVHGTQAPLALEVPDALQG